MFHSQLLLQLLDTDRNIHLYTHTERDTYEQITKATICEVSEFCCTIDLCSVQSTST